MLNRLVVASRKSVYLVSARGRHTKEQVAALDENINIHEALDVLKGLTWAKFDETIDISVNLNLDPRKPNQSIKGVAKLPSGTGKTIRVAVFAQGDDAVAATAAGADIVGAEDLLQRIQGGDLGFDTLIATPDMMGMVGKLGRVLGPRGLMPNPKLGTVTKNVAEAVQDKKQGAVQYRVEKKGIVHAGIGKLSFSNEALMHNIRSFMMSIADNKPEGLKGNYMKSASISSTMGPGIRVEISSVDPGSPKFLLTTDELLVNK
jgi:large subunit ribosomal protein L1